MWKLIYKMFCFNTIGKVKVITDGKPQTANSVMYFCHSPKYCTWMQYYSNLTAYKKYSSFPIYLFTFFLLSSTLKWSWSIKVEVSFEKIYWKSGLTKAQVQPIKGLRVLVFSNVIICNKTYLQLTSPSLLFL